MAVAVLDHELPTEGEGPGAARQGQKSASFVKGCVPWHAEVGREVKRIVPELARLLGGSINQRRTKAAALPASQHRELVEPSRAAWKLHQCKADNAVERRGCDPQPAVASALLERCDTGGRA